MKRYIKSAVVDPRDEQDPYTKAYIAKNDLSLRCIYDLANDPDSSARRGVADNPNCPDELLVQLAKDPEFIVRLGVALNPKTPTSVLEDLAHDSNKWVAENAMGNPSIPIETVLYIFRSNHPYGPYYSAALGGLIKQLDNHDLPLDALQVLAKYPDDAVNDKANAQLTRMRRSR